MQKMTIGEIAQATRGSLVFGDMNQRISGISTDTRTIKKGEVFVALAGEKFDGHTFLEDAVEKGAGAILVSKSPDKDYGVPVICVGDTLESLGDLAMHYRRRFHPKVIAVTGSTGKTSTKDMIGALLEQKFSVLKTFGNFNNEVGLPLTILELEDAHDFLVVEMGMRGLGQIARLCDIAKPDVGVVTNVNETHIELLGSVERIAEAKSELIRSLPSAGFAILNKDNLYAWSMHENAKCPVKSFGFDPSADVRAEEVRMIPGEGMEFKLITPKFSGKVFLSVQGIHHIMNALAAVCAVLDYGIELDDIVSAFSNFSLTEGRTSVLSLPNGITLIDDTYNASPVSTKAALELLRELAGSRRKVAVLGDMFELGDYERLGHMDVGRACVRTGVDLLVIVGSISKYIQEGAVLEGFSESDIIHFQDSLHAAGSIAAIVEPGDVILVKGSRGMKMERVVEVLQKEIAK